MSHAFCVWIAYFGGLISGAAVMWLLSQWRHIR